MLVEAGYKWPLILNEGLGPAHTLKPSQSQA